MKKIQKSSLYIVATLILCVGSFVFGVYMGFNNRPSVSFITGIDNKEVPADIKADFGPFWQVWRMLDDKHPDASKTTAQDRVYGAISGLAASFNDPYTTFFPPAENEQFQSSLNGSFTGVGMEVGMKDKVITVISPLKDTPAEKAGIKAGDKILKIDKQITSDMTVEKAISLIRGEKGTSVTLTIFRDGESAPREISIVRDTIDVPTLETDARKDGIFVIRLFTFTQTSPTLFANALKEFKASGDQKLIIDLRGNPGGYLEAAVDMASWFIPGGKPVVIEDSGKPNEKQTYRSHGYNLFDKNPKVAILIDSGSASASEILAGAFQDYKIATLVGTQSYGKGSVQEMLPVTKDTAVKITIAKWFTPNGTSINDHGLTPDVAASITQKDVDQKLDPQLDAAVSVLNK